MKPILDKEQPRPMGKRFPRIDQRHLVPPKQLRQDLIDLEHGKMSPNADMRASSEL